MPESHGRERPSYTMYTEQAHSVVCSLHLADLARASRLYTMARDDLYDRRMFLLEMAIVIFFAVDFLILLLKK